MKKPGHYLADIAGQSPPNLLEGLQSRFAITTAEELISATAQSGDQLREALAVDHKDWDDLVTTAGNILGPEERQRLSGPMARKPAGVTLKRLTPDQIVRHAPGLTRE